MSLAGGEPVVEALAEPSADGGWTIRSPRVGIVRGLPREGGHRAEGDPVGRLSVLERSAALVLPAGVEGLVTELEIHDRAAAVEYGQPLFRLAPAAEAPRPGAPRPARGAGGAAASLPEGSHAVVAPIDGIFYSRPSPAAAPFVEPGSAIEAGRPLGLIEAMKSFNAVLYGGPGLPSPAIIVEARVTDASEVRQGAILFVVRSA